MPTMSNTQYLNLMSTVVKKSYRVYHSKAGAIVSFRTYKQAKAYCIKHKLNYKSTWILNIVNHCA